MAAPDCLTWCGEGVIAVYGADKVAWAADRARVVAVDGRVTVRSADRRVRRRVRTAVSRAGHAGLWVPQVELERLGLTPDATVDAGTNLLTTAGATRVWNLATNQGATQAFDATHTRVGAGNGTAAASASDTDLSAASGANRYFNLVDAASTVSTNTNRWTSTFATGNGNFAWNEWGVDQGTAGGTTVTAPLLNHAVPAGGLGTKTSAASWAFTVTFTLA